MNDSLTYMVLLTQLAATLFMTGVTWFVQVVQYPLLAVIDPDDVPSYEQRHLALTPRVVALPMFLEAITAIMLLVIRPIGVEDWMVWAGLGLLVLVAYSTVVTEFFGMRQLALEFDPDVLRRLLRTNWIRTWSWSLRSVLVIWMVANTLQASQNSGSHKGHPHGSGPQVGDAAPDFQATTFDGKPISLADFRGKRGVVLFFYPKDGTSVCTKEACAFRDSYEKFAAAGAEVIGVSGDSADSHEKFSQQYKLTFPLISDADGSLRKKYSVPTTLGLIPGRVTFVIDQEGTVRMMFSALFASDEHVQRALQALQSDGKHEAGTSKTTDPRREPGIECDQ